MSFNTDLLPSQILAGYHKLKNNFLRIDFGSYTTSKNNKVRYSKIQLYVKTSDKYEWVEAPAVMVRNAVSGRVKTYEERENDQCQDRPTTTFRKTTVYKRKSGSEEKLGEALCAIYEAFIYQITKALEDTHNKVPSFTNKVFSQAQFEANSKDGSGKITITNPVIRILVPFRQQKDRSMKLECDLYDMRKPISEEEFAERIADEDDPTKEGDISLERAKVGDDPITVENIHLFLKSRTIVSGIIDISSVCFSQQGISLPAKWTVLIAKPGSGTRHNGAKIFNKNELKSMLADAESCDVPDDEFSDSEEPPAEDEPAPPIGADDYDGADDGDDGDDNDDDDGDNQDLEVDE